MTILFSFGLLLFPGVLDFNIPLTKFGRLCINYSISIFSFFLTNRSIVGYSCILSSYMIAMYPGYATVTGDHKSVLERIPLSMLREWYCFPWIEKKKKLNRQHCPRSWFLTLSIVFRYSESGVIRYLETQRCSTCTFIREITFQLMSSKSASPLDVLSKLLFCILHLVWRHRHEMPTPSWKSC